MKNISIALALAFGLAAGGCAGSVSAPEAVQAMSTDQRANLHLSKVTADAADGVAMSDTDFAVVCDKVKAYLQSETPGVLNEGDASLYHMNIHFTRFDRGSAFARAMLIGLGQIQIEATVDVTDANSNMIGRYKVSKDFALGGIAGATTTVEDVEDGFAKSVVEIMKMKA